MSLHISCNKAGFRIFSHLVNYGISNAMRKTHGVTPSSAFTDSAARESPGIGLGGLHLPFFTDNILAMIIIIMAFS